MFSLTLDRSPCTTPSPRTSPVHVLENRTKVQTSSLGIINPEMYKSFASSEEITFPEEHHGRIWFSLLYQSETESLQVTIVKIRNLPSRTVANSNSCDPYVKIALLPDDRRTCQTKQKKKSCNPIFNEQFKFQVNWREIPKRILKFTVIDGGRNKDNNVLGTITYPLRDLTSDKEKTFWEDLQKDQVLEKIPSLGQLLVSLQYNDTHSKLYVTIVELKEVEIQVPSDGYYVKVSLQENNKPVKSKKTQIVTFKSTVTPPERVSFNECFNFKVKSQEMARCSIKLKVHQGKDHCIGWIVLGSYMFARGKGQTHWDTMVTRPKEWHQEWHQISN